MKTKAVGLLAVVGMWCAGLYASELPEAQRLEIQAEIDALEARRAEAFVSGDCDTVLSFFDGDGVFFIRGRQLPSRQAILHTCRAVPRPFPTAGVQQNEVHVLSPDTAYSVQAFSLPEARNEVVSKVWKRFDDGWRIVHLHVSITDVSEGAQR
jgi:uncharacterized protein (TIGR02246 family)